MQALETALSNVLDVFKSLILMGCVITLLTLFSAEEKMVTATLAPNLLLFLECR